MEQHDAKCLVVQTLLFSGRLGLSAERRLQHGAAAEAALCANKQVQKQVCYRSIWCHSYHVDYSETVTNW
jgi:hypothetical protein